VFLLKPKTEPLTPVVSETPSTTVPTPAIETPPSTATENPVTEPPAGTNIPAPTPISPPVPTASETTTSDTTSPPTTPEAVNPTEGVDQDADGLTDREEVLYSANVSNPDTDGDSYQDGAEVRNVFSPAAKNKALGAEAFMQALSWSDLSIVVPKVWSLVIDPTNSQAAALSTGSSSIFNMVLRTNPSHTTLAEWVGSDSSGTTAFKTKGGYDAMQTSNGLTTYVAIGDKILVITYDLNGDASYDYRTSYAMVLNSLSLAK